MSGGGVWKAATFVLGTSTLVLAGLLLARPEKSSESVASAAEAAPVVPLAPEATEGDPRIRSRVDARAVARDGGSATAGAPDRDPGRGLPNPRRIRPEVMTALDRLSVEEVCLRLVQPAVHGHPPPLRMELMARLEKDPEAASVVLADWLDRRAEIATTGTPFNTGDVAGALAELAGFDAYPQLSRMLFEENERAVMLGVFITRHPDLLERIRSFNRTASAGELLPPSIVWTQLEDGPDLVREWAFADEASAPLRKRARKFLWSIGTPADRDRVLDTATFDEAMELPTPPGASWAGTRARLDAYTASHLDDADPWVRLLAQRRVLRFRVFVEPSLVARAAEGAREDVRAPNPGGRAPDVWKKLQRKVRRDLEIYDRALEVERRLREVAGVPIGGGDSEESSEATED